MQVSWFENKKYPMVFTLNKVQFGKYYVKIMWKTTWNASLWIDRPSEWFHKLDFGFFMCSRFAIEWVGLLNYEVIVVLAFWFYKFHVPFIIWTHKKEDVGPRQKTNKCRWSSWREAKTKNIEWHGITYGPWICAYEFCGNPRPNSVNPKTCMLSKL